MPPRALLLLGCASGIVIANPAQALNVAASDAKAVVQIVIFDPGNQPIAAGSGTFVDAQGDILTNWHVLQPEIQAPGYYRVVVYLTPDTRTPPAQGLLTRIIAADQMLDLALIRATHWFEAATGRVVDLSLQHFAFPYVSLKRSATDYGLALGDDIEILGYPAAGGETITFTKGVVSGFVPLAYNGHSLPWQLKTDAKINHGNSGGAAFDARGAFVGVPVAFAGGDGNIGYVISLPVVDLFLDRSLGPVAASTPMPAAPPRRTARRRAPARSAAPPRQACEGGDATACVQLGAAYLDGKGVSQDAGEAARWFRKGCDAGSAQGCTSLGALYASGQGVSRDVHEAYLLDQKGCDGGDAWGCTNLAFDYEHGSGVARSLREAVRLYGKACDGGSAPGCTDLGVLYERGRGVARSDQQAARFYQKGCDGDDARGCYDLGALYQEGRGVPADRARAWGLYSKACDGGDQGSCDFLAKYPRP